MRKMVSPIKVCFSVSEAGKLDDIASPACLETECVCDVGGIQIAQAMEQQSQPMPSATSAPLSLHPNPQTSCPPY